MYLKGLILLLLVLALVNCRSDCPLDEEPVMKATLQWYDTTTREYRDMSYYKRIYGLGGNGNVVVSDNYAYLPLSLRADSVTYIFEPIDGPNDTLILCYRRDFGPYETDENRCGYGADFSGGAYIYGSKELTSGLNDTRYGGVSRTTFEYGDAQYRGRIGNQWELRNIYEVDLYR